MTFGQAKSFATNRMGDCGSTISEADWEVLMSNSLQTILDSLTMSSRATSRITVTTVRGTASYVCVLRPVQVELADRILISGEPFARLPGETALLASPVMYHWENGHIILTPTPDLVYTVSIEVENSPSTILYTGSGDSKVWNQIPLQVPLHPIYAKLLAGMALLDYDPARSSNWMNLAMSEVERWKDAQERVVNTRFKMGAVQVDRRLLFGSGHQPFPGSSKRIQYVLPEV